MIHLSIGYQKRLYIYTQLYLKDMRRYTNVALPSDLIEQIDKIIKKKGMGYKSRGEFVKEAVRSSLKTLKNYLE